MGVDRLSEGVWSGGSDGLPDQQREYKVPLPDPLSKSHPL